MSITKDMDQENMKQSCHVANKEALPVLKQEDRVSFMQHLYILRNLTLKTEHKHTAICLHRQGAWAHAPICPICPSADRCRIPERLDLLFVMCEITVAKIISGLFLKEEFKDIRKKCNQVGDH